MVTEFDVNDFLSNCRSSKPPYSCPCGKTYKSLSGIQQHVNISHLINQSNKKKILNSTNKKNPMFYDEDSNTNLNLSSTKTNNIGKTRETLTYAESQRMIEVEIDGLIHRININEPMNIISIDPDLNNKNDKTSDNYQLSNQIYSNQDSFLNNNIASSSNHVNTAKKTTKKSKSLSKTTKDSKSIKSSKHQSSNLNNHDQLIKLPEPSFRIINNRKSIKAPPRPISYYRYIDKSIEELDETVEYDMDEEDFSWLELINKQRQKDNLTIIPPDTFELLMDRLEKECYFLNKTNGNGDSSPAIDEDAVCCICNDGECQNSNAILFCDMCDLPCHQDCYGVPYIPEGQWLCRRCLQSPSRSVSCILCPNKGGAFKQTDDGRWCHVVCALWIPEVCFANTVFLEPIDNISAIPAARWKLICYICKEKNNGACIQCHKSSCYVAFHVTCAQQAGLHMRMEAVREFNSTTGVNTYIKKEAFCHTHMPTGSVNNLKSLRNNEENSEETDNDQQTDDDEYEEEDEESSFSEEDDKDDSKKYKKSFLNSSSKSNKNKKISSGKTNLKENNFNEATLSQKRQMKAKMKKARRILAEKRSACPTVSIPTIPAERLTEIAKLINIPKRNHFVQRLLGYWTLKRESRNGVPLLRRLQVSNANSRNRSVKNGDESSEEHNNEQTIQLKSELKELYRLRQDLERARILVELIRKREKVKREKIRNLEQITQLQLNPFNIFLDSVLNQLKSKDQHGFFLEPVDTNEVHDYLQFIKKPMSFQEMKYKIDHFEYDSFDEFENDFNLIIDNCTTYNQKQTIYFKSAIKLKEQCKGIFKQAKQMINEIDFDEKKGIHNLLPEILEEPRPFVQFAKDDYKMQLMNRLEELNIDLELAQSKKSGGSRTKKLKNINSEINKVKKELFSLDGFNSFIDKDEQQSTSNELSTFNSESQPLLKSLKNKSKSSQKNELLINNSKKQNGTTNKSTSDSPAVYPVFNFKNSSKNNSFNHSTKNTPSTSKKRTNTEANNSDSNSNKKQKKSINNEINMKPITSYYQVLQNNLDSFKNYRSKSDSSDSQASDRNNSDNSSSSSNTSTSSTSSSSDPNNGSLNEEDVDDEDSIVDNESILNEAEDSSLEEEEEEESNKSNKKRAKKSH